MENTLLNLIPAAYLPEIHLSQYDVGRTITFTLKDGASDYSVPSGASVKVKATKPSGFGFEVACTFNGGTVTLVTTDTMTPENGRFPAELSIVSGNTTIGTSNFIFNIERSPHPEGTIDGDAETIIPELTLLVERIEAAAEDVDEDTQIVTEAKAEVLQAKADTLSARDDALQAKADAITAKESAEASAQAAAESAQAAAESAQEAEDTLSDYAKVDGYYEEMAVGSAEQLLSAQFVDDSVPYKFRTSGGSKDIGNREYDEIVGGSIVWNQLVKNGNFADGTQYWASTTASLSVSSNVATITLLGGVWNNDIRQSFAPLIKGHKYYITFYHKESSGLSDAYVTARTAVNYIKNVPYSADWSKVNIIWNMSGTTETAPTLIIGLAIDASSYTGETVSYKDVQVFDLTQMFGSTIADYIYSLETAEAGKGVAFFKSLFPNDYYPYNAGELMSVEGLQSHDTVGFNQWDEEWEVGDINANTGVNASGNYLRSKNYIPIISGATYYGLFPSTFGAFLYYYDANKTYLGHSPSQIRNATFTVPNGTNYIRFVIDDSYGTTYKNDICINLSWSGWRNGEYEPYKKHSYPLDSSLTLRGIPKLNSQNELYFDGDIYSHDGKVQRKYGVVVYDGSNDEDWRAETRPQSYVGTNFYIKKPTDMNPSVTLAVINNMMLNILPNSKINGGYVQDGLMLSANWFNFIIGNMIGITTVDDFRTWLSTHNIQVLYPLATPTEETAEPYASPQNVDDFGTEEYISGNVVPVGHNTQYPANLRDKLQHLPNMADSDGYYMISQQNKQMSLELFRIPKAPTTDGTYTLKATVSGGTPTYIWEAVE